MSALVILFIVFGLGVLLIISGPTKPVSKETNNSHIPDLKTWPEEKFDNQKKSINDNYDHLERDTPIEYHGYLDSDDRDSLFEDAARIVVESHARGDYYQNMQFQFDDGLLVKIVKIEN